MSTYAYASLILAIVLIAATWDAVWLRHIRPWLARTRGWAPVPVDAHIPLYAWAGTAVAFLLFAWVAHAGATAGL